MNVAKYIARKRKKTKEDAQSRAVVRTKQQDVEENDNKPILEHVQLKKKTLEVLDQDINVYKTVQKNCRLSKDDISDIPDGVLLRWKGCTFIHFCNMAAPSAVDPGGGTGGGNGAAAGASEEAGASDTAAGASAGAGGAAEGGARTTTATATSASTRRSSGPTATPTRRGGPPTWEETAAIMMIRTPGRM